MCRGRIRGPRRSSDLASADTSRLIRTPRRRPNIRLLVRKKFSASSGFLVLGALCRMRPRLRSTLISLRRSRQVANVDGSARDRNRSPSSLSIGASIPDMPSRPASSASSSNSAIRSSSASVGSTSSVVARSSPSTEVRRSEWPSMELTFGPSGRSSSVCDVFGGTGPSLLGLERAEHELARHRLDAAEQVGGVLGVGVDRRQRAVAEQHRGDAVPHRLAQARVEQHLGVVVGVHVDEAGDDPLAVGVDDVGAARLVERLGGHRGHDAVANAQRAALRAGARSVEPQSVANDHVVSHAEDATKDSECLQSFCPFSFDYSRRHDTTGDRALARHHREWPHVRTQQRAGRRTLCSTRPPCSPRRKVATRRVAYLTAAAKMFSGTDFHYVEQWYGERLGDPGVRRNHRRQATSTAST